MQSIIRRFDRAPLEDRILRANPAQPSKPKTKGAFTPAPAPAAGVAPGEQRPQQQRRDRRRGARTKDSQPRSAFAAELAKAL
jgi:hypothetical protein